MTRVDQRSLLHLSRTMDPYGARTTTVRSHAPHTALTSAVFAATALTSLFGMPPARAQATGAPVVRTAPEPKLQLPASYALRLTKSPGVISIVPNAAHEDIGAWVADPKNEDGAALMVAGPKGQDVELAYVTQTDGVTDPVSKKPGSVLIVTRPDGSPLGECWKIGNKFEFRAPPDAEGNTVQLKAEYRKDGRLLLGKVGSLGLVASRSLGEPFEDVVVQRFDQTPTAPISSTGPLTAAQTQEVLISATAAYLHDLVKPPEAEASQQPQSPQGQQGPKQHFYTNPLVVETAVGVGAIALEFVLAREFAPRAWCFPQYAHNYSYGPRVLPNAHNYYAGPGIPPAAHNPGTWSPPGIWHGGGGGPPRGGTGGGGFTGGGFGPIKGGPVKGGPVTGTGWDFGGKGGVKK